MNIADASGKGGTGKTLMSAGIFHSHQEEGVDAIFVDCNAEAPDVHGVFRAEWVARLNAIEFKET